MLQPTHSPDRNMGFILASQSFLRLTLIATERYIIVKNRISIFSLRLVEISEVKLIRLVHKYSGNFYNPSLSKEPLFWRNTVCGGDGSYIDIPESLRRVSSTINPEDIYSFKGLSIDGKPVPFRKNISYKSSNQIEFQTTCNKIAEPRRTHHVSYVEEGLYEIDDWYGDEIRSCYEDALIIIEKPEKLPVNITLPNLFGENATKDVLWNSSRLCCVVIRGNLTSGNGFTIQWRQISARTKNLDKMFGVVTKLEKNQQILIEGIREVKTETIETKELSQKILAIVQQNPNSVQVLLNEQLDELRQLLLETANELKDKDPHKAKEARRWYNHVEKGISVTADLIQIVTFLVGIPSLPALVNKDIAKRAIEFLKRMTR